MTELEPKPLRVLVTGATGFLGSAVAEECRRAGLQVRATARRTDSENALPGYVPCDIRDPEAVRRIVPNIDAIIHAAGVAHRFDRSARASDTYETNVTGTANLIQAARAARVARFVLVSSVSVYGLQGEANDESSACHPTGEYAQSKYLAEQTTQTAAKGDVGLTILRMATIYGEGDPGNVGRLMRAIDRNRFIWIGEGSNRKSLIHREDAARACRLALESDVTRGQIYNVIGETCAMRDVAVRLASALGRKLPAWHLPGPLVMGMVRFARELTGGSGVLESSEETLRRWLSEDVFGGDKFRRDTGFRAKISLAQGLAREVGWYRSISSRYPLDR